MKEQLPKALYKGKLPIGDIELDCAVLDDKHNTHIISARTISAAFGRTSRGLNSEQKERVETSLKERFPSADLPHATSFLTSQGLIPFLSQDFLKLARTLKYVDNGQEVEGYNAEILYEICNVYLKARRAGVLLPRQNHLAQQAEMLLASFAKVGIVALIDEATGFQQNRKSDALRLLLQAYLADEIKKWVKEFPDDFFFELDRLYGNQPMKANKRPMYYGRFINTYVYEPLEKGKINPELQKRYKNDNKKHRKHQHFTEFGSNQLRIQIGKILGLMQVAPNMNWFKQKQNRQGQLSLFPEIDD